MVQKHTYREGTKVEKRKHPTLLSNQFICLYVWNMYLLLVVCIAADGDDLVEIFSMDLLFCCRYNSAIHLENFLPSICFSTSPSKVYPCCHVDLYYKTLTFRNYCKALSLAEVAGSKELYSED